MNRNQNQAVLAQVVRAERCGVHHTGLVDYEGCAVRYKCRPIVTVSWIIIP